MKESQAKSTIYSNEVEQELIKRLFKRFQQQYLHKWTSAIDGIEQGVADEWLIGLRGYSKDQIKRGLDDWQEEWPPTLPEFKKACEGKLKGNHGGRDFTPQAMRGPEPVPMDKRLESDQSKEEKRKLAEKRKAKFKQMKQEIWK